MDEQSNNQTPAETTVPAEKNGSKWTKALGLLVIALLVLAGVWTVWQFTPFASEAFTNVSAAVGALTQIFIPAGNRTNAPAVTATSSLGLPNEWSAATTTGQKPATSPYVPAPTASSSAQAPAPSTHTVQAGQKTEHVYGLGTSTPVTGVPGKPDLMAKILDIGTIDKTTNAFTSTTTLHSSDRIAVRFEVENVGTADSPMWSFNAVLPSYPSNIFQSETQAALAPGDRIEYTIGFDQGDPHGDGRFVVNVDPANSISEISKTNNIATTSLPILP